MLNLNQKQILRILAWTEQEYANFQYESGLLYLENYIPADKHGIDMLSRSRFFWKWWKNHWSQRDAQFLYDFEESQLEYKVLGRVYECLFHDVKTLINEIYPNATVLSASYARMIDDFHNQKTEA